MGPDTTELAIEQAYFDRAAEVRDRKLTDLSDLPDAGAHPAAAAHLRRHARAAADALGGSSTAVAVGRTDAEDGERVYVGRHLIRDDANEVLVVSWKAPAAAGYFQATPADPCGLRRKRTFDCEANTIFDFTDIVFTGTSADAASDADADADAGADVETETETNADSAAGVDEFLLRELSRGRTGTMRDIVATIQAAQYDVIRSPFEQLLVIEGGPGTGKTALALHRVSWLLFHHRARMAAPDVLVVGPHPTFVRYVATVLPSLGDEQVELRDLSQLAPSVPRGRSEPGPVSRLKGEARMAGLLARALASRVGAPEPAERLLLGGRFVTIPGAEVATAVDAARVADLPYSDRRRLLRDQLGQLLLTRTGTDPAGSEALANLVERLWPQQSAPAFLRDLFASRQRLRAAAEGEFTADELELLRRRPADRVSEELWSGADLPLLDEIEHLLNGVPRRYAHIVVDEAQDLSPMQLRSVARRSGTGSLTLVGDLAQSTGPWARDSWEEVTRHLPRTQPETVAPLRYGYRVPRQVYEFAARLLPVAAPAVTPPEVVREGPAEPRVHRVSLTERAGRAVAVAAGYAADRQFVGIVCPDRCRRELEEALAANGVGWSSAERGELGAAVNVVSPREAKGLEFDAVVVVEPEQIVAEDDRGHRLLYVALTRTVRRLDIVCVGEPLPMAVPRPRAPDAESDSAGFTDADAGRVAEHVAGQIRAAAPSTAYPRVLERLRDLLNQE